MLFAISLNKTADGFELGCIDQVEAANIQPDDVRIFVARESDVDWVVDALLSNLNNEAAR